MKNRFLVKARERFAARFSVVAGLLWLWIPAAIGQTTSSVVRPVRSHPPVVNLDIKAGAVGLTSTESPNYTLVETSPLVGFGGGIRFPISSRWSVGGRVGTVFPTKEATRDGLYTKLTVAGTYEGVVAWKLPGKRSVTVSAAFGGAVGALRAGDTAGFRYDTQATAGYTGTGGVEFGVARRVALFLEAGYMNLPSRTYTTIAPRQHQLAESGVHGAVGVRYFFR